MILDSLAARMRHAREMKQMTQEQLARAVESTQDQIQKIENGKSLRPRNLEKIAKALDVSPSWLAFGDEHIDMIANDPEFFSAWAKLTDEQRAAMRAAVLSIAKQKT